MERVKRVFVPRWIEPMINFVKIFGHPLPDENIWGAVLDYSSNRVLMLGGEGADLMFVGWC